ncbi:hypothetical protein [Sphingomonas gilva]|uniref:hypothetical protein n=1 Tax=Sphingomonas gilva TaxID=2305907 RepID=UPI0011C43605|nr:hypothetical protein [Sphingomonas gilva]
MRLLRAQLERADKANRSKKKDAAGRTDEVRERPLDRVRSLASIDTMEEEDLRRAVVRGLLAERFGEAITNDAAFQGIAKDVTRMIEETPEGRALIDRAVASLRVEPRSP